jgi:hypothetical protein
MIKHSAHIGLALLLSLHALHARSTTSPRSNSRITATGTATQSTSPRAHATFDSAAALVELEITRTRHDYRLPWVTRNIQTRKNGILIGEHQILTTADGLSGQTLCRIRKGGITHQYTATLKWVDYYSNLAMFDVEDPVFWQGMRPTRLSKSIPHSGELQVIRWSKGRIEERAAEIIRLYIGTSKTSYIYHLNLYVSTEIDAGGWAEVVLDQNEIIGLTTSSSDDKLTILPAPFITAVLKQKAQAHDSGIGHFDFNVMKGNNPALLNSKGMPDTDIGVVVIKVGARRLAPNTLHPGDVLLAIDGFEIDNDGKYIDPTHGRLSLYGIATRNHAAGDTIPMRIWRGAQALNIDYSLPRAQFEKDLVPAEAFDQAPEYLIAGGLLFQPITGPYLKAYGKNKPLLLDYYSYNAELPDRSKLVVLSTVIPDPFNRGYEDIRQLIVDSINGHPIDTITDVAHALENPQSEFHRIKFMPDQGLKHIVLDAATMDAATQRILKHYNIPKARSE